ncbi:MAG: AhpC/TSA family protein [Myxococcales bacterium]|nr:AhpC/TSA family protein [Myxococcales bacterium]
MLCFAHAAEFRPHEQELGAAGTRLVFLGTGSVRQAARFRRRAGIQSDVWVDPEEQTYRRLGFARGLLTVLRPPALKAYARAALRGYIHYWIEGDPFQQGGVLVVKRGGEPVLFHPSSFSGDVPPTEEVLQAAKRAAR